jgi:hypothetical protein
MGQLDQTPRVVSKEIAQEALKEFKTTYRSKDERIRLAAVDRLTTYQHALVAKGLADVLRRDSSSKVRAAAAVRLGLQEWDEVHKPLRIAWIQKANRKEPEILMAVTEAWRKLERSPPLKELTRDWDEHTKEVQRSVIRTTVFVRDTATVEWLAPLLDNPRPVDVDDPNNPPADHWKDKIIRWHFWVVDVQSALADLTDRDFESTKEVREWLSEGGKVLVSRKKAK